MAGAGARYAVVEPSVVEHLTTITGYAPARMQALLAERFEPAAEIGGAAGVARQQIYVRRPGPRVSVR